MMIKRLTGEHPSHALSVCLSAAEVGIRLIEGGKMSNCCSIVCVAATRCRAPCVISSFWHLTDRNVPLSLRADVNEPGAAEKQPASVFKAEQILLDRCLDVWYTNMIDSREALLASL